MSKTINLGAVTAYADAVAAGYTGTREQFAQDLANAATYAAESHDSAETASAAADTATEAASAASLDAEAAAGSASSAHDDAVAALAAKEAAETASTTAVNKAGEAINAAASAGNSATSASSSATAASGSATAAAGSASDAAASETAAAGSATSAAGSASAAAQTLVDVNAAGATQVAAIGAKGEEVLESIPDDYTTLSNDVDDLKSNLNTFADVVLEEYTLTSASIIHFNIGPSTNKWTQGSQYDSYYVQLPATAKIVKIVAGVTNGVAFAVLAAGDTHTHGDTPVYATGCARTLIAAGQEQYIYLPDDAEYIWITKTLNGGDYAPTYYGLNVYLPDMQDTINDITSSNVNLWTGDASVTFTKSKIVTFAPLPAGTYNLSAVVTSDDTDYTYCRAAIGSTTVDLTRGERANATFTKSVPFDSITFYASRNDTYSEGDTATWADIQISSGSYASEYVPHQLIAKDTVARDAIAKMIKFVSANGNDTNDGNTPTSAYATLAKALSVTADVIYLAHGTYNEGTIPENTNYRYKGVKIVGDRATINLGVQGLQFRYTNVDISGLIIDATDASNTSSYGMLLLNCTGAVSDCIVIGAKGAGGYRIDGSQVTMTRCVAYNCAVDGFNGHTVNTGYETECTLIDCIAHDCGDDGASIHEAGTMYVYGGEYYNNVQTGLAPHNKCKFEAFNVHCHHNGKGIEAIEDTLASGDTPATGRVIGCILNDNTTYGLDAQNYIVNALANGYANNGTAPTHAGTGATINAFDVT